MLTGELSTPVGMSGELSTPVGMSGEMYRGVSSNNYNDLENKPTYNGHIIKGDLTSDILGIWQPKNFSTDEQNTGLKWIDGKDVYFKTFEVTLNSNTITIPNTTDVDKIILVFGFTDVQSDGVVYHVPYADADDYITFANTTNGIQIYLSNWFKSRSPVAKPIIFYTKN